MFLTKDRKSTPFDDKWSDKSICEYGAKFDKKWSDTVMCGYGAKQLPEICASTLTKKCTYSNTVYISCQKCFGCASKICLLDTKVTDPQTSKIVLVL